MVKIAVLRSVFATKKLPQCFFCHSSPSPLGELPQTGEGNAPSIPQSSYIPSIRVCLSSQHFWHLNTQLNSTLLLVGAYGLLFTGFIGPLNQSEVCPSFAGCP